MKISWSVFFAMWAWILAVSILVSGGYGLGFFFLMAVAFRLGGYERGWRRLTVMLFLSSSFLLLISPFYNHLR